MSRKRQTVALTPVAKPIGTLAERRPDLADAADDFAQASLSDATRKATQADWKVFAAWCAEQGLQAMPASVDTVAGFLADQAKAKKVATLQRYRATIGKLHKLRGFSSPFADARVKAVLEGIRRTKGVAQSRKAPVMLSIASSAVTVRDRAILLLGLATSFRGKELCSLDVDDLERTDAGFLVHLRRSKTDQIGAGRTVGAPRLDDAPDLCPVRAVEAWIACLGDRGGPLFRGFLRNGKPSERRLSRGTVNAIVKRVASLAGLDPMKFGAHSLRAGYVTEARIAGLGWEAIMEQTGHKRIETVKRYSRDTVDPFKASKVADVFNAAAKALKKK